MIRRVTKIVSFIGILIILISIYHQVFCFKYTDGIYQMKKFYEEEKDSIDIVFLGSSHMFCNVSPSVLWKEYGIAGYDLCGSGQPIWNSYYYMKEALKTQKPSLFVLDCYMAVWLDKDYMEEGRIIQNNYGMNFSKDKINSIKASAPKETWTNYLLEYPTYHRRYMDLTKQDFISYYDTDFADINMWKGQGLLTDINSQEKPQIEITENVAEISEKNETYLRKIIELSKEEKIPLVLIVVPYVVNMQDMERYNHVKEIADEYGIDFINFNYYYEDMRLDFSMDYRDRVHMNYMGSEKFTRYLVDYLKKDFAMKDHRDENSKEYYSYDTMVQYYDQYIYNAELRNTIDLQSYMSKLQNEHYVTVFSVVGDYKSVSNYAELKKVFGLYGINLDEAEGNEAWAVHNGDILFTTNGNKEYCWHKEMSKYNTLTIQSKLDEVEDINGSIQAGGSIPQEVLASTETLPEVMINSSPYNSVNNGLNVLTYDLLTDTIIEYKGFAIYGEEISYNKQ